MIIFIAVLKSTFFIIAALAGAIFLWYLWSYWGIFIFVLIFIFVIILLCLKEKSSLPLLNLLIKNHYFSIAFRMARIENKNLKKGVSFGRQIKLFFYKIYFKFIYYIVLVFNNPKESFYILKEELQRKNKKRVSIKIKTDGRVRMVDIEQLSEKIKRGEMKPSDQRLINKLLDKLYQLHKEKKRGITIFSLTGIVVIIIATAISNLLLSLTLPVILRTKTLSYSWTQKSWAGGTSFDRPIHPLNQSGWDKYYQKDSKISASGNLTIEYPDSGSGDLPLTSSIYNSSDSSNVISKIRWKEELPQGTDIKFQLRTSPDNFIWTEWAGPDGPNDYYTNPTGKERVHPAHSDGRDDQWFQYRVFLSSDGQNTPILSEVVVGYKVRGGR